MTSRLASGGRIDRSKPLRLRFNGAPIDAFAGDTVASALLANDVRLVGRSFKYHRPRGIVAHGSEEPNALVRIDRGSGRVDPNALATVVEAVDGMAVTSQNHWPSLERDLGALNDVLAPVFVAGFYYKTFMWPRKAWDKVYEPMLRRIAGLGVTPAGSDPDRYLNRFAHCDVLVAGAGPAGLSAALAASESGKRVVIADEQAEFGGTLLHEPAATIDGVPATSWLAQTIATLASRPNVTLLPRTTVFGYYNDNLVAMLERVSDHLASAPPALPRQRVWQVRANEVVLATGAHERPLIFADNDRPGIMLAESVRAYINRYAIAPGRRIVFATSSASAYTAAFDAAEAGLAVQIVDVRAESASATDVAAARERGITVFPQHTVLGSTGAARVQSLIVAPLDARGNAGARSAIACDCVGVSGGWTPAVHLFSQSHGKLRYDPALDAYIPGTSAQRERSAGASNGVYALDACLAEGWRAGCAASGRDGSRAFAVTPQSRTSTAATHTLPSDRLAARRRAFVDFQNDVSVKDVKLAVREGFENIEHVKRYTTVGMGTDQGKTSNMLALGVLSDVLARPVETIGTTKFRPPYTPVAFGALAGPARRELYDPVRKAPLHEWAAARGAVFEDVGLWKRARYFPKSGESMHDAVDRECIAVRKAAGIFDGSTLGKIEVVGPDSAEFLTRLYVNDWRKLAVGKCGYGLMLREDGYIFDDGIVARLADDRFHVTTTTGGAARVFAHMEEYLQTEWPELDVFLTSTTEQWAVIAVQGPRAQEIVAPLVTDIDFAAFPHMSMRSGRICGVPTRLFRVSFTGELGYEINVGTSDAQLVWDALYERGAKLGIEPYGTEAMHVLRAERGFIIVGQETDGTMTPDDVGLGGMIARSKSDFIGKRSLARPDLLAPGRKQMVGLLTEDASLLLDEGAQIVDDPQQPIPMKMIGHVTSAYRSAACGRTIALAVIAGGRSRLDQTVYVTTPEGFTPVKICKPVFLS